MLNPRLTETLSDYPFARLNALIADLKPPAHLPLINLSVGEPQGALPAFARKILADEVEGWSKYPPNQGVADLNVAIVEWLNRRYRLPDGLLDPARHVIPTAGSKEGVYAIATVATPQDKGGARPVVSIPNPFYQAYLGGAVLSGAEPLSRQRRCFHGLPARLRAHSPRRPGSGWRSSTSARPPTRRAQSPAWTTCRS